jgi:hypothetical protein
MRGVRADVGLRQTFELERHLDIQSKEMTNGVCR